MDSQTGYPGNARNTHLAEKVESTSHELHCTSSTCSTSEQLNKSPNECGNACGVVIRFQSLEEEVEVQRLLV